MSGPRRLLSFTAVAVLLVLATSSSPATAVTIGPSIAAASPAAGHPTSLHAASLLRFDTQDELNAARDDAERLRGRLAQLRARDDWTNERLAYVQGKLATAATSSVSAEQQLAALQGADLAASEELAHRVQAIEQSGGVMALYAHVWEGSSFGDVASNIASLDAVVGIDSAASANATSASMQAAELHKRLASVTDQQVKLVKRASALAAEADRLLTAQESLIANANQDVRVLARQLAKDREADAAAAAAAASGQYTLPGTTHVGGNDYAAAAITAATSKLGSPYIWGAEGPDTFDCSGLVQWSYAQAGLLLPRLASDQYFASTPVAVESMQPGDLLVYAYDPNDDNTIHHITMYIGNGLMIHAPHTGDVVRVAPVYYDGLYGVGRPGL